MKFEENNIYHIYNRGNNHASIFFDEENYLFFLQKLKKELTPYCKILAYCLMPNHFHLMVWVGDLETRPTAQSGRTGSDIFSRKTGTLLSSYTRVINKQQNRTGSLFQQKTKAKCLTQSGENYPKICFHYIHQNPLRAKLVTKMEDWEFSSFKDYVALRNGTLAEIKFCKEKIEIAITPEELYQESYSIISEEVIDKLY
ncbi:MAG: transposase [Vicingaceae bacterium]